MQIYSNPTQVISGQHVLSMTRGLYPPFDCDLDRVTSVKVICDVFGERSHKKGNHLHSIVEACMAHWNLTLGHIHAVSHRYVV